MVKCMSIY